MKMNLVFCYISWVIMFAIQLKYCLLSVLPLMDRKQCPTITSAQPEGKRCPVLSINVLFLVFDISSFLLSSFGFHMWQNGGASCHLWLLLPFVFQNIPLLAAITVFLWQTSCLLVSSGVMIASWMCPNMGSVQNWRWCVGRVCKPTTAITVSLYAGLTSNFLSSSHFSPFSNVKCRVKPQEKKGNWIEHQAAVEIKPLTFFFLTGHVCLLHIQHTHTLYKCKQHTYNQMSLYSAYMTYMLHTQPILTLHKHPYSHEVSP